MALQQRLLRDLAEIQEKPYPNIRVRTHDADLTTACLILTPNGDIPLHLTVEFPPNYPLNPPKITIQSIIDHPNVFGNYICASILNTREGYTPAYTLKGVCIQILSFFSSDSLEQSNGKKVDLRSYQADSYGTGYFLSPRPFTCTHCSFDDALHNLASSRFRSSARASLFDFVRHDRGRSANLVSQDFPPLQPSANESPAIKTLDITQLQIQPRNDGTGISHLPDELLSLICSYLEVEELAPFSQAWDRIGGEHGIISNFNIIRNRELICFCLKRDFKDAILGVGVHVGRKGKLGSFESEFDLLSLEAFTDHDVRHSVQGLQFEHWLPLPISRSHWQSVRQMVTERLRLLGEAANFRINTREPIVDVIYAFMNDIVVRLCTDAEHLELRTSTSSGRGSSLLHASEKAIESYYHLYHLLLCLATSTSNPQIVRNANRTIKSFLDGNTSKERVPNLGYLLIMVLISDADMTIDLLMAIIRETVTRNVVWVLDKRGANMPELAYMEANAVSMYRLQKTFEASLTSYRLLMFLNLFRRTINRGNRTLSQLRESLFDAHGAPPRGTAARLANNIKSLQAVKSFPEFLTIMGLAPPPASKFTAFLRDCVEASMVKGYSVWGITQERALTLRKMKDAEVQERKPEDQKPQWKQWNGRNTMEVSFFPSFGRGRGAGAGAGAAGAGRGSGRGY